MLPKLPDPHPYFVDRPDPRRETRNTLRPLDHRWWSRFCIDPERQASDPGRIEIRHYALGSHIDWLEAKADWAGLQHDRIYR